MFPERLAQLRKNSDLTQQQVADLLCMRRDVYRRYEKGIYELPLWALIKLTKLYKVTSDYILELDT
ncbi:MAG: helix-turn-helix transcriptional regulator [Clostridia bacterium]|nr:helix-turn-helix transcriptional regulator [Clostridia bacterium]